MTMQNWVDRMIYLTFCAARYNNNNSNSHKSNNNKDRCWCCCCCLVYVACGLKFQLTTTTRTTTTATATWVYRQNQSWPKGKPKRGKLVSCCSRERKTLIKINNAKGWVKCAQTQTHTLTGGDCVLFVSKNFPGLATTSWFGASSRQLHRKLPQPLDTLRSPRLPPPPLVLNLISTLCSWARDCIAPSSLLVALCTASLWQRQLVKS